MGYPHVRQFLAVDRVGAVAGLAFVVLVNGLFVEEPLVWWIVPPLLVLIGALSLALRWYDEGRLVAALAATAGGNWLVALVVPLVLPVLWPVMVITVLVQVVLAAPHVPSSRLVPGLGVATAVATVVALEGLLLDDGGAIPDMDDTAEVLLVLGALAGQIIPLALLSWQNHQHHSTQLAALADLAASLEDSRIELTRSRRRVVEAADAERGRIERDLHDGAQQHLVALRVRLGILAEQADGHPELVADVLALRTDLEAALVEIRELAHGIYPPVLRTRGVAAAVRSAARRAPSVVELEVDEVGRLVPAVEAALYFTASEALANCGKHAPDAAVRVRVAADDERVVLVVEDDGPGFDPEAVGGSHGLANLRDRIHAVGGTVQLRTSPGTGCRIEATVPRSLGSEVERGTTGETSRLSGH